MEKIQFLNIINVNGEVTEISKEVIDINDIESVDDKLYLLGRVKNNNYSIYELNNGVIKDYYLIFQMCFMQKKDYQLMKLEKYYL